MSAESRRRNTQDARGQPLQKLAIPTAQGFLPPTHRLEAAAEDEDAVRQVGQHGALGGAVAPEALQRGSGDRASANSRLAACIARRALALWRVLRDLAPPACLQHAFVQRAPLHLHWQCEEERLSLSGLRKPGQQACVDQAQRG